jgi:hypothetical protein
VSARFFVDENDLALGKMLSASYGDVVFPGHAALPEVPRGSFDDDWLPVIGRRSLVVITRDKRIRYRPVEKRAWVQHRVRGFVLTGRTSQTTTNSFAVLARHWPHIERLTAERPQGSWMYAVTEGRLREIDLREPEGG